MQDMFYIMNVKACDTSKTWAALLLSSQRANKGIVNVRKQAIHNFKLVCCQLSHIIMQPEKMGEKNQKIYTELELWITGKKPKFYQQEHG